MYSIIIPFILLTTFIADTIICENRYIITNNGIISTGNHQYINVLRSIVHITKKYTHKYINAVIELTPSLCLNFEIIISPYFLELYITL